MDAERGLLVRGLDGDDTAVRFDDLLNDKEAEPEAARLRRAVLRCLPERLEQLAERIARDGRAAIGHRDVDPVFVGRQAHGYGRLAGTVRERVSNKVRDHLPHPADVPAPTQLASS